jgi:hypothetical protein
VKRLTRKDKKRLNEMGDLLHEQAVTMGDLAELLREQAITEEDLAEFSPGLRKRVKGICTIKVRKNSLC